MDHGDQMIPIEIKSGRTLHNQFFKSLKYFQSASGALPENSYLIYGGDEVQKRSVAHVLNWKKLDEVPL